MRTIKVLKPTTTYEEVEVNLINFLDSNIAELVVNRESQCLDIRFPTRHSACSNYVGFISWAVLEEELDEIKEIITCNRHMDILKKYVNDIHIAKTFDDCVLQSY